MTPEAKVKHQVYKILRKNGAYYFSPIMNGYGKSGVPDIIVCYNGKFVGIECKVGKKKPTELQQKNLGCRSFLVVFVDFNWLPHILQFRMGS